MTDDLRERSASPVSASLFGRFGHPLALEEASRRDEGGIDLRTPTRLGFVGIEGDAARAVVLTDGAVTIAVHGDPTDGKAGSLRAIAAALLRAYRARGPAAIEDIPGACCAAIADDDARRLVLAVDRMGIAQLFYGTRPGGIAFATSAGVAARLCGEPRIDCQGLYHYAYFHVVPSPGSIYAGIARLGPGEMLQWHDGRMERRRYWRAHYVEDHRAPFEVLRRDFRAALEQAVRDALGTRRCGAFLSGGTDSSTIAGFIGRCTGTPAATYSIGFEADGYDEMAYARITAQHFGTDHHEYYVTPDDVVAAVPELARIHDQPFGNSSAVPAYCCARLAAADGVERMIAGDGGDELFGGNARYATQQVLAQYERLPAALRERVIEPLARRLPTAIPPLRKVRSYVEQASVPMPARTETYNLLRWFGVANVFRREILAEVDAGAPLRLQAEEYFNPTAHALVNRQLALDLKFTLADNDIPKVTRSCELAGLPAAFPMLDRRVVDFSLGLAPELKLRGTRLRWFFKQALADFLPPATLRKQKHGFGMPFGPWVVTHAALRELAFDSIGDLAGRRIFADAWLASLPRRVDEHPAYYGTMVWVLMMLEQWLRVHAPATRFG